MERKRRALSEQAMREHSFIEYKDERIAAVTVNSDGAGSTRSYLHFFYGEGMFVAIMAGKDVVAAKFLQNNGRRDVRNLKGSVAIAEVVGMVDLARSLLEGTPFYSDRVSTSHRTKLHISQLAADGDTKVICALRDMQTNMGVPPAGKVAVICHEIKNLGKAILNAKKTDLRGVRSLDSGRVKALGKDVRDVLGRCGSELRPILKAKSFPHALQTTVLFFRAGFPTSRLEDMIPKLCLKSVFRTRVLPRVVAVSIFLSNFLLVLVLIIIVLVLLCHCLCETL